MLFDGRARETSRRLAGRGDLAGPLKTRVKGHVVLKEYGLIVLILGLFGTGTFIALASGTGSRDWARSTRPYLANLGALGVRLLGYIAALMALQKLIGSPSFLAW